MNLSVNQLSFSYQCFPVLKEVDFSFQDGNLICVLGKNGVGKSTLFRCMLGLLKEYRGEILIDGQNIKALREWELAKRIAYIPQNHDSAFAFSVLDMVLMGTTVSLPRFSSPGKRQKEAAMQALSMLSVEGLAHRSYAHISGGEQQLVLIARALAQQAKILMMDEPCANLDYGNQARVMEALQKLARGGYLVLQSTHNPEHAFLYADQAMVLQEGKVSACGVPSEILTKTLLEEMYGISIRLYEIEEENIRVCIPERDKERGRKNEEDENNGSNNNGSSSYGRSSQWVSK